MICPVCRRMIDEGLDRCPYCKNKLDYLVSYGKAQQERISQRKNTIQHFFEINNDYNKLTTRELNAYFNKLEARLDSLQDSLSDDKLKEMLDHILAVDAKVQENNPIRINDILESLNELTKNSCDPKTRALIDSIKNNTGVDILEDAKKILGANSTLNNLDVLKLLFNLKTEASLTPIASILRSQFDINLNKVYGYQYHLVRENNGTIKYLFEKSFSEMLDRVTNGNNGDRNEILTARTYMNLMIHQNPGNDIRLNNKFKSFDEKLTFLKRTLELHKKYSLI